MTERALPGIEIYPHADCPDLSLAVLRKQTMEALPLCLACPGTEAPLLRDLDEVEINLTSDETIATVHGEFMDDPTPTDVITFHHGEIFVSVETAEREARTHGNSVAEEVLLYIIHGLLHLNGHTDLAELERDQMTREQERILRNILDGPAAQ
ncbi:MAG: rRNA maturation RNase YbeY [Verrucomicrobiales bacterium]